MYEPRRIPEESVDPIASGAEFQLVGAAPGAVHLGGKLESPRLWLGHSVGAVNTLITGAAHQFFPGGAADSRCVSSTFIAHRHRKILYVNHQPPVFWLTGRK
jgi:hypothetical protein